MRETRRTTHSDGCDGDGGGGGGSGSGSGGGGGGGGSTSTLTDSVSPSLPTRRLPPATRHPPTAHSRPCNMSMLCMHIARVRMYLSQFFQLAANRLFCFNYAIGRSEKQRLILVGLSRKNERTKEMTRKWQVETHLSARARARGVSQISLKRSSGKIRCRHLYDKAGTCFCELIELQIDALHLALCMCTKG